MAYLSQKRQSVFHRAFEHEAKVRDFKPPEYEKKQTEIDALVEMY